MILRRLRFWSPLLNASCLLIQGKWCFQPAHEAINVKARPCIVPEYLAQAVSKGLHMRLFLIEDDLAIQQFVRQALVQAGHQVDTAADGKRAVLRSAIIAPSLATRRRAWTGLMGAQGWLSTWTPPGTRPRE